MLVGQVTDAAQADPQSLSAQWDFVTRAPLVAIVVAAGLSLAIWAMIHWAYRGRLDSKEAQIESKDSHIDLLKAQLEAALLKQGLKDAVPDEARETIKEIERRVMALEPRRLTLEQKQAIGKFIRKHPDLGGAIYLAYDSACTDGQPLATEIRALLSHAANTTIQQVGIVGLGYRVPSGLEVRSASFESPAARLVTGAFDAASIDYDARTESDPRCDVEIVVTAPTPK